MKSSRRNDNIGSKSLIIFVFVSGFLTNSLVQKTQADDGTLENYSLKAHRGQNRPHYQCEGITNN